VTELAFFALPKSASDAQRSSLEDVVLNLAKICMHGFIGGGEGGGGDEGRFSEVRASGFATGWVLEEMDHHSGTEGKAISFALMLGWRSKEEHLRAKEAAAFQEAVRPVREMTLPAEPGRAMYHVHFTSDGALG
jgi:hypothetical protein